MTTDDSIAQEPLDLDKLIQLAEEYGLSKAHAEEFQNYGFVIVAKAKENPEKWIKIEMLTESQSAEVMSLIVALPRLIRYAIAIRNNADDRYAAGNTVL